MNTEPVECEGCGDDIGPGQGMTLDELGVTYRDPMRTGFYCPICAVPLPWIGLAFDRLHDEALRDLWPEDIVRLTEHIRDRLCEYFAVRLFPPRPGETPAGTSERIKSEIARAFTAEPHTTKRPGDA